MTERKRASISCVYKAQGHISKVGNVVPCVDTPSHITFPPDLMRLSESDLNDLSWTGVLTSGTTRKKSFIVSTIVTN